MATKKKATQPELDLFSSAPVQDAPTKGKKDQPRVPMGQAVETLAAVEFVITSLEGMKKGLDEQVKDEMKDRFVEEGMKASAKPENFKGEHGKGVVDCQLRRRTSASILTEAEVEELAKHKIQVEEKEVSPEMFLFNPEVLSDPTLRAKVSAALNSIDFGVDAQGNKRSPILRRERVVAKVASDEAIAQVLKTIKDRGLVCKLLSSLTTPAVKCTWMGTKEEALKIVEKENKQ